MKDSHVTSCIKEKLQLLDNSEDAFYKKPWFWVCITIIIMCLTRPHVRVTCGNGNGCSGNKVSNTGKEDLG